MKIDFHVHAFNEKVAEKAIAKLEAVSGFTPYTRGLISQTMDCMDRWNIDKFVLLPIATKPTQQKVINDWSFEQNKNDRIIAFGSVHPDAEDAFEELERIKAMGLKGVKFHPDYQGFEIDEERVYPLYRKCAELGLIVVFHAGWDCISPDYIHVMPEMSARAHKAVPEMKMVLAHLGGNLRWESVYEHLAGLDGELYFDTSMLAGHISPELMLKIIKKHGADRILFASDCPWGSSESNAQLVESLSLTDEEKEMIFHKNAERLLGL